MPWFVAFRAIVRDDRTSVENEYRVFSESQIDTLGPEWDWASTMFARRDEADDQCDELFWDNLPDASPRDTRR